MRYIKNLFLVLLLSLSEFSAFSQNSVCPNCHGTGSLGSGNCYTCAGRGRISVSNGSSTNQSIDNINVKLPITYEVPFPMGKLVTTINENGTVSQYSLTNCESCNMGIPGAAAPVGFCQICKGARGRMLYGGMWSECSYCSGTGYCRTCHGTGQKKIFYYQDRYGMPIAVDMNGNVFLPTVGSNEPGYRDRTHMEKVGEKIYEPSHFTESRKWCDKCNSYKQPHAHLDVYRVAP